MAISLQPNVWHVKNSEGDYLSSAILSTTLPQEADAILQRVRSALNAEEIDANTFKEGFSDDLDSLVSDARGTLDQMLEEQEQLISDIRSTAQAKTDAESAAAAAAQSATAASGSATAAAGSASNASDSANAAGQSASAASQSATNASNSATAASGSASDASNSATAAAGSASDARTVLNSVVAEAQDILDSIPNDYSDLSDDVDQLKIDITKKANAALITSIESTSTASKNYAIGDVLLYNNKLYVTTSVITTGATLTPGTNIIETTVIARLLDLETRLKSGTLDNADLHLGLYVDSDGDISQVDN